MFHNVSASAASAELWRESINGWILVIGTLAMRHIEFCLVTNKFYVHKVILFDIWYIMLNRVKFNTLCA